MNTAESATFKTEIKGAGARLAILPRYFGHRLMIVVESTIYSWAERLSPDQYSAYWNYYSLSNGGFFMAPRDTGKKVQVVCSGNYYEGEMSEEAFGIVACLYAYNAIAARDGITEEEQEQLVDHYYALRNFAAEHPEASAIQEAIN